MENDHLYILWTNADILTSEKMVFMYALNSLRRGWWKKITIIVWGAPAKLVSENELIQLKVKQAIEEGIHITACKACADQFGTTKKLEELNVEVKYWGEPLTDLIKKKVHLLTI
jgi:hypothetical protein